MEHIFFNMNDLKYVGENVRIGKTVRIRRPEMVSIGDNSIIDDYTYISCEMTLGKCSHVSSNVNISGGSSKFITGDYVAISSGCSIHAASSSYLVASLDLPSVPNDIRFGGESEKIMFGDHVILGSHTVVLPGVNLPVGAASTALTVLRKKEYEEWTLYSGHEGKKLIKRNHIKLDRVLMSIGD